jgi:membrane protease YdiL (CAAX protease family)
MYDKDSKGISFKAGFFMLIAFTVAGVFIASLISIPVWQVMTGIDITKMEKAMSDPANADAVKVIQCITAVIGFLLPSIVTAWMLNRKPMKLMGFSYNINWKQAGIVCAIMFAALFVSGFFAYINDHLPISESLRATFDRLEREYNKQVEAILSFKNTGDYLIALFIMAFLPAVCEEALFRGGLQNYLTRWSRNPWLSIIIVSILFSAAHFSFYGFLSRVFLGIMLGLIYQYSGRLWLSILAHFFNNAFAITVIYVIKQQGKPLKEAIAETNSTWVGIFALPIVIALLIFFKKIANKPTGEESGTGRNEELRNTPFY